MRRTLLTLLFATLVASTALARADVTYAEHTEAHYRNGGTFTGKADAVAGVLRVDSRFDNSDTIPSPLALVAGGDAGGVDGSAWIDRTYSIALQPNTSYRLALTVDIPTTGVDAPQIGVTQGPYPYLPTAPEQSRSAVTMDITVSNGNDASDGGIGGTYLLACTGGVLPDPGGGYCKDPGTLSLSGTYTTGAVVDAPLSLEVWLGATTTTDDRDRSSWASAAVHVGHLFVDGADLG